MAGRGGRVTDYSWVSGVDGDWNESGDWDNGVPSTSDASVTIDATAAGPYTVTIASDEGFAVDSVTLNNAHATLAVAGTLTLGGGFDIAAGKITGSGNLFVSGGSIGGGTVSVANQSISGTVTLSSALTDSGAVALGSSGSDTLALGANTLKLTGTGSTVAGTLTGAGMLALAGGSQAVNSGASLGMAKLGMSGSDSLSVNTSLTYAGTLTQAAGTALAVADGKTLTLTGTARLSGSVSGDVDVNAGKLLLDSEGNGAELALAGGSLSVIRDLTYAGGFADTGGTIMLGGRTLTMTGAANLTNVTVMTAGTLSTKGKTSLGGVTVEAGASLLNFGNATDSGIITLGDANTASLFVNNAGATLSLTNGMAITGTIGSTGRNDQGIGANAAIKPGSILRNKGHLIAEHGGGRGGVRIVISNAATGYTVEIDVAFQNSSTGTVAVQSGTLKFDGSFTNANTTTGAISVSAGSILDLRGGGTSSAEAFAVAVGGTLKFAGGTFTLTGRTLRGRVILAGGMLELGTNAVTATGAFAQAGGSSLDGAGVLTLAGAANFAGGTDTIMSQTGVGKTVIQDKATVAIDFALSNGRVLQNDGMLVWSGGNFELGRNPGGVSTSGGGRIRNDAGATFVIAGNGVIGGYASGSSLINSGTVIKSTSAGNATIAVNFENLGIVRVNTGTLELAGQVFGSGGGFKISNGSTLEVDAALPSTQALTFGAGGGTLVLNDTAAYGATIASFGADTAIDIAGFKFSGKPKAGFVEAASKKQGVLTVTDGSQSLKITLFGQYVAAGFHLAAGSGGGTVLTYAAPPAAHIVLAAGH
jgi:fibronectin-binding autotransporter adhesin